MPIIAAIVGAIATGVVYWIIFGNGRDVINAWLDSRNEKARAERDLAAALHGRAIEARAPLRALTDPRDAATALLVALAEARGEMTPEQTDVIKALLHSVLRIDDDAAQRIALAIHASRRAGSPEVVMDEALPVFRETLDDDERRDLLDMARAVSGVHGGPTDRQEQLIERLENRLTMDRRPGKP